MKKILFTLLSAAIAVSAAAGDKNYLRYVDPYIGAAATAMFSSGPAFPSVRYRSDRKISSKAGTGVPATTIRTTC